MKTIREPARDIPVVASAHVVSHRLPLEELERGIELIEKESGTMKVLVVPNG